MAIDDNTSYELLGSQVKDLANTINAKAESSDIPTQTSDLTNDGSDGTSTYVEADDLATVATSGNYSDLTGTPTIPTKTSDLTNDGSDGTSTYVEANNLATVATSGSYNDLSNQPTIPAAQVNSDWTANSGVSQILNKPSLAAVATSGAYSDLSGTPSLATVATSGSYSDLSDKPTIPTVNNATLTIQKNGTTVKTFTANASSNVTCNITTDVTSTTSRLDVGKWHFYYVGFVNSTSGLSNHDITVPSDFADKVTAIWGTGRYGNSGDNYVAAWSHPSGTTYRVRTKQASAGSNGWDVVVLAIF